MEALRHSRTVQNAGHSCFIYALAQIVLKISIILSIAIISRTIRHPTKVDIVTAYAESVQCDSEDNKDKNMKMLLHEA